MAKKRGKRGANSYLNDFHLNVSGEYVYEGELYALEDKPQHAAKKKKFWVLTALLTAVSVAGGCLPAPGMRNCFYVILPYLGELTCSLLVAWAAVRLGTNWSAVREYVYKRSVPVLPRRAAAAAVFAALGAAAEIVFLAVAAEERHLPWGAVYLLLKAVGFFAAWEIRRFFLASNWGKVSDDSVC